MKKIIAGFSIAALAGAVVVVPASPASAQVYYGKKSIWKFGCNGKLDIDHRGKGKWYARGRFYTSNDWATRCRVKIQRKKGNGSWKTVSRVGLLDAGGSSVARYNTAWYWDSDPYKARVCIEYFDQDKWYCSGSY
ncbi:hypothetical protein [Actinomadura macrotermitis]|uniref:Secreted protein n=1 Tax=Actinomadura macrotermitis TaxID=2585200 RepID=A0A7K0BVV4_9ACTN|nr:hypothetical protein [Actinomadura macrotermitis]MQY05299.1 hypothetical protein [Actinomadura macrotermitis]